MGVCLGHQILGLAIGATTSRLPYGHRGANQPIKDLDTGRAHITSQNHGFQVDAASIPPGSGFRVSHVNLNDGSVEGLAHDSLPGLLGPVPPGSQSQPHRTTSTSSTAFLDLVDGNRRS